MAVAGDVPHKYDLVLNGVGYLFAEQEDARAVYGFTPTFVDRANTQGDYGDDYQAFWMTASQNDWSLGEHQRFLRLQDDESRSRYWTGVAADVQTPGQVTLRRATSSVTAAAAPKAVIGRGADIFYATTTNLYGIAADGTITDHGAHGLGAAPATLVTVGLSLFLSTTAAGTVGVRRWDGAAFSTFSATGADSLEYLNNTLYGHRNTAGTLVRYDTAGAATTLHTWKDADGTALTSTTGVGFTGLLRAFGSKLLIMRTGLAASAAPSTELWLYDGAAVTAVAKFPVNFVGLDIEVVAGVAFVGGFSFTNTTAYPTIYYWANGTADILWRSATSAAGYGVAVANLNGGLLFTDDAAGSLKFYDLASGGIHTVGGYTVAGDTPLLAASAQHALHTRNQTTAYRYPASTTATTGSVTSSLIDFSSSRTKLMRGITVDFTAGTDGNGGSVDIAYRVGDVDGSYTTLQTGAVSGTEYTLSGVSGQSISVKVTLNKGTSTSGPVLKRAYVRAAPLLATYKRRQYVVSCAGRNGDQHLRLHDGSPHPDDGLAQATNLNTAASATSPFSITDRFGTYTGIVEPDGLEIIEVRPEEFVARVKTREV